jgi:hypothetical protein
MVRNSNSFDLSYWRACWIALVEWNHSCHTAAACLLHGYWEPALCPRARRFHLPSA